MKFKLTSRGDKEPESERRQITAIVIVDGIIIVLAVLYVIGKYI